MLSSFDKERVCRILVRLALQIQEIERKKEEEIDKTAPLSTEATENIVIGVETHPVAVDDQCWGVRTPIYVHAGEGRSQLD